ncbi:MAG: ferritin-like domain-containing protein [Anaerolineae bacterium]
MNPQLIESLQVQFNKERQNGAVYDALAGAFEYLNLSGFARFMARNGDEERGHAKKFFGYLADVGEQPQIRALAEVGVMVGTDLFASTLAMFNAALSAEQQNLASLYLVHAACSNAVSADPATVSFLFPILDEQIASIKEFTERVTRVTLAQGDGAALIALDHELAED